MADQSDVEDALVAQVAGVLYPAGADGASTLGRICRVYRGWPAGAALDADLAGGRVNVTVFPTPRPIVVTTRTPVVERPAVVVTPSLVLSVSGHSVIVSGSAALGQVAGIWADSIAVVHRTARGDTPEMVAAVLASYLRSHFIVTVAGASLQIHGARLVIGRVVADQELLRETRRQRQVFRITVWCPEPVLRDRAAAAIDTRFSALDFLALDDGTQGRVRFVGSSVLDQSQNARLYRRDLLYSVEYATTVRETLPAMIFGDVRFGPLALIG